MVGDLLARVAGAAARAEETVAWRSRMGRVREMPVYINMLVISVHRLSTGPHRARNTVKQY